MAWNVLLRGEDGMEFVIATEAKTIGAARDEAEENYPESHVLQVFDPVEREERLYREANERYENPDLDDYDY
jgi:hypothetical protein